MKDKNKEHTTTHNRNRASFAPTTTMPRRRNGSRSVNVHILCWDGRRYTRTATREEVEKRRKEGSLRVRPDGSLEFDFMTEAAKAKVKADAERDAKSK